jgi:Protein HRI1
VADAGDMHVQPNGEVLEQGSMINPSTNKVEQYEECWVDLKDEDGREKVGWVLKVEEEGMKGMMVRVGGWIQGVLRRGEEFEVARWRFTERKGWEQLVGIGRLELPREVFWHEGVRDGVKFMGNQGEEWVCVESFTWT